MTKRTRRTSGAAAVSLVGVTFLPFASFGATGDVDVSIVNHSRQDVVNGPNVSVETSFTSLTSHSIDRVEFLVDGRVTAAQRLGEPERKGNYVFAWDTTSLSNDVHTIEARAYDDQGNLGEARLQLFVDNQAIDRALPRVRVTVPAEGAVVSGQFWIQVNTAQESLESVSLLSLKLDDDLVGGLGIAPGEHSVRMLYDGSQLNDGPHYIQAGGVTSGGSRVVSPPIVIIVNKARGNTPMNPGAPPTAVPEAPGSTPESIPPSSVPLKVPGSGDLNPNFVDLAHGVGIPQSLGESSPIVPATPRRGPVQASKSTPLTSTRHSVPVTTQTSHPGTPPVEVALAPIGGGVVQQRFQGWFMPGELDGQHSVPPSSTVPRTSALRISAPTAARSHSRDTASSQSAQPADVILVEPGTTGRAAPANPVRPTPSSSLAAPRTAAEAVALAPRLVGHPAPAPGISPSTTFFVPIPVVLEPQTTASRAVKVAMRPPSDRSEAARIRMMAHQSNTPQWLRVAYDNHWMNFDVPPMMVRGVAEMPFRALFEQGGGSVDWHPDTHTVTAAKPGRTVELKIGSRNALVNQQVVQLIMPAFIKRGRTMIPLGFIRQAMNVNVQYNQKTGEVILTSKRVLAMVIH